MFKCSSNRKISSRSFVIDLQSHTRSYTNNPLPSVKDLSNLQLQTNSFLAVEYVNHPDLESSLSVRDFDQKNPRITGPLNNQTKSPILVLFKTISFLYEDSSISPFSKLTSAKNPYFRTLDVWRQASGKYTCLLFELSKSPNISILDLGLESLLKKPQIIKSLSKFPSLTMVDFSKAGDNLFFTDASDKIHQISFKYKY